MLQSLKYLCNPSLDLIQDKQNSLASGAQHWTQHSQFIASVLSRVEGSCIHPLKLCLKKKWKAFLGAQWRPHQSFELPGGVSNFCLHAALPAVLLSEQTKAHVSVRRLCLCVLFTPDLDHSWWRLHVIEMGCPGTLCPREVSEHFKCSIGVCPGMQWSKEGYVICFFWKTALMKNSGGNAFLLFTASSSSLQLQKERLLFWGTLMCGSF